MINIQDNDQDCIMTFSILARDPQTGAIGGAAATGSYCVGGWVLRGSLTAGISASQGASTSTLWGEDVLAAMQRGQCAAEAVASVTLSDSGRAFRQLAAVDLRGNTGVFTGDRNTPETGSRVFEGGVTAGNMLARADVVDTLAETFQSTHGAFSQRLLTALRAAQTRGGDRRGLFSAALLVLHPDHAPLTLRVDHHPTDPIGALTDLHRLATTGDYARWLGHVPVLSDKERGLD